MDASNIVLAGMGFTTVMVVIGDLTGDKAERFPKATILFGAVATTIILELIAEVEPQFAVAMTLLIATAALVSPSSTPMFDLITKLTTKSSKTVSTVPAGTVLN